MVGTLVPRAPLTITPAIASFAAELARDSRPVEVPIEPVPDATPLDCFAAVERVVTERGGDIFTGWRIFENPGFWLEAEFHAVWRRPDGLLLDITPAQAPFKRALFVPDPSAVYEGRQVNNRFWPLSGHPAITDFLAAQEREFELMNRGQRAWEHGGIRLSGDEMDEYAAIMEAKERSLALLQSARQWRTGRNDPCPCGSGRKHKKCCLAAAQAEYLH